MATFSVLVYEGWGKTYLVEADSAEEAEAKYHAEAMSPEKAKINETFVVEVTA